MAKVQESRYKAQGARNKVQGTRNRTQGTKYENADLAVGFLNLVPLQCYFKLVIPVWANAEFLIERPD